MSYDVKTTSKLLENLQNVFFDFKKIGIEVFCILRRPNTRPFLKIQYKMMPFMTLYDVVLRQNKNLRIDVYFS